MSDFSITINDNGLSAQLTLDSNDSTPSKEDILKKCKDLKISHGIEIDLAVEKIRIFNRAHNFCQMYKAKIRGRNFFQMGC